MSKLKISDFERNYIFERIKNFHEFRKQLNGQEKLNIDLNEAFKKTFRGYISIENAKSIFEDLFPISSDLEKCFINGLFNNSEISPLNFYLEFKSAADIGFFTFLVNIDLGKLNKIILLFFHNCISSKEKRILISVLGIQQENDKLGEILSNYYIDFSLNKNEISPYIKRFLISFRDTIKFVVINRKKLDEFFYSLDIKFRTQNAIIIDSAITNKFIIEYFNNDTNLYRNAKNHIRYEFNKLLNSGLKGVLLTKDEARYKLFIILKKQLSLLNQLQELEPYQVTQINVINKLLTIQNNKPVIYDTVFDDLYPYWDYKSYDSLIFDEDGNILKETVNISEYEIASSTEINLSSNLTASVKDFLGNIMVPKGNKKSVASFGHMYLKTLQLFQNINFNSNKDFLTSLKYSLDKEGHSIKNTILYNKIVDLYRLATNNFIIIDNEKKFFNPKYKFGDLNTFYYTNSDLNLFNLSNQEFLNKVESGEILKIERSSFKIGNKNLKEFNTDFYNRINNTVGLNITDINNLWAKENAAVTFRELYSHFSSQTENSLIDFKQYDSFKTGFSNEIDLKFPDSKFSIITELLFSIVNMFNNLKRSDYLDNELRLEKSIGYKLNDLLRFFEKGIDVPEDLKEDLKTNSGLTDIVELRKYYFIKFLFLQRFESHFLDYLITPKNYVNVSGLILQIFCDISNNSFFGKNKCNIQDIGLKFKFEYFNIIDFLELKSTFIYLENLNEILITGDEYLNTSTILDVEKNGLNYYSIRTFSSSVVKFLINDKYHKNIHRKFEFLNLKWLKEFNFFLSYKSELRSEYKMVIDQSFKKHSLIFENNNIIKLNLVLLTSSNCNNHTSSSFYFHALYNNDNVVNLLQIKFLKRSEIKDGILDILNQIIYLNSNKAEYLTFCNNIYPTFISSASYDLFNNCNFLEVNNYLEHFDSFIDTVFNRLEKESEDLAKYLFESKFIFTNEAQNRLVKLLNFYDPIDFKSSESRRKRNFEISLIRSWANFNDKSEYWYTCVLISKMLYTNWYLNSFFLGQIICNGKYFFKDINEISDTIKFFHLPYQGSLYSLEKFEPKTCNIIFLSNFKKVSFSDFNLFDFFTCLISDSCSFMELINQVNLQDDNCLELQNQLNIVMKLCEVFEVRFKKSLFIGFHTPSRSLNLQKSHSSLINFNEVLDFILYMNINESLIYSGLVNNFNIINNIEFSTIELNEELCYFPKLNRLRRNMEQNGIDHVLISNKKDLNLSNWILNEISKIDDQNILKVSNINMKLKASTDCKTWNMRHQISLSNNYFKENPFSSHFE